MGTLWQIAQKINTEQCSAALGEPMWAHTTFKIGGPADLYVRPRSIRALTEALDRLRSAGLPVFLLGGGANILVGDRGIRGAVIDMGLLSSIRAGAFGESADSDAEQTRGQIALHAECGASVSALCEEALVRGLSGLENFYGMPGSVGGAIYMNARCYEDDISSHIKKITYIDAVGALQEIAAASLPWSYKRSPFMCGEALAGSTVGAAMFMLVPDNPQRIAGRMRARLADRMQKHHFDYPSAGSMFKNNRAFGKPTGKILHELGLRGYRIGNAAISSWHANIFINLGGATARDMRALIEHAQAVVFAATGWHLEPEVLFVGEF
ncbi:UDP-N-acetylenolpyruvoylglucosamine reductase [uncultured spirochete]|jgi:UDP-N-acetylmuramate dehydrogenase|uniref:UDP-N-acetylenolpyruvoylglucosamine reductase n=1 Tax=uncultured spirochete TaxID=156406 RepID=A0A3P3XUK0_9SPIR|nr:UDP-N-acetylenolpyruvoylglucosamine reductase [uncultured spirochete]